MTLLRIKTFLALLYTAPVTLLIAVTPIMHILAGHIAMALTVSRADPWAKRVWWDWWGSWIFIGGPFGRFLIGSVLGFRLIESSRPEDRVRYPGQTIQEPHLTIVFVAGMGLVLSLFSMVSALHLQSLHF